MSKAYKVFKACESLQRGANGPKNGKVLYRVFFFTGTPPKNSKYKKVYQKVNLG